MLFIMVVDELYSQGPKLCLFGTVFGAYPGKDFPIVSGSRPCPRIYTHASEFFARAHCPKYQGCLGISIHADESLHPLREDALSVMS